MNKAKFIRLGILSAIIVLVFGVLKINSAPEEKPVQFADISGAFEKIFGDEFDGASLDTSQWVTCYDWYDAKNKGCSNYGNDEQEWYLKENVQIANGYATLTAQKAEINGIGADGKYKFYPYSSGMISTGRPSLQDKAKWVNNYGYYEARIMTDGGKGIWPAFWLLPEGKTWPPEIDIMEILGDKPNEILNTYFWKSGNSSDKDSSVFTSSYSYLHSWHTYAINWQPDSIDWFIDGKKVKTATNNIPSEKLAMVINLAVGGRLPGNPDGSTHFPVTTKIDYVRVYKKID